MKPTKALLDMFVNAIKATTVLGSPADTAKLVMLFKNDVEPTEATLIGDLDEADFTDYARAEVPELAAMAGSDPLSLERELLVPSGDLIWETTDAVGLPQTIFGFALLNHAGTALLAAETFPEPIELTEAGQIITVDKLAIRFAGSAFE